MQDPSTVLIMSSRYRTHPEPAEGLEAARRVGWAKFYAELERAEGLSTMNHQQRERISLLLGVLADLVEAVLTAKNLDAFAQAMKIQTLLDALGRDE